MAKVGCRAGHDTRASAGVAVRVVVAKVRAATGMAVVATAEAAAAVGAMETAVAGREKVEAARVAAARVEEARVGEAMVAETMAATTAVQEVRPGRRDTRASAAEAVTATVAVATGRAVVVKAAK